MLEETGLLSYLSYSLISLSPIPRQRPNQYSLWRLALGAARHERKDVNDPTNAAVVEPTLQGAQSTQGSRPVVAGKHMRA
jgi:hypothetical protein